MSIPEPSEPKPLRERIQRIVDEEVLPLLQMDGGGVEVIDIADGVVRVRMHGTCSGCAASVHAVVMGVEHELRSRVPEIAYLEAVP